MGHPMALAQCHSFPPPHHATPAGPAAPSASLVQHAVPVEDGRAVSADRGVAVEGEEHVALLTELADKAFCLAALVGSRQRVPTVPGRDPCTPTWRWPHQSYTMDCGRGCPTALAHLAVQLDVFGEEGVDLRQGAAQASGFDVDQVLQRVHLVVLHKVLPVLQLQADSPSPPCLSPLCLSSPCPSPLCLVPHSPVVPPAQLPTASQLTCSSSRASIASLQVMK